MKIEINMNTENPFRSDPKKAEMAEMAEAIKAEFREKFINALTGKNASVVGDLAELLALLSPAARPPSPIEDPEMCMLMMAVMVDKMGGEVVFKKSDFELFDGKRALCQTRNDDLDIILKLVNREEVEQLTKDRPGDVMIKSSMVNSDKFGF